MVQNLPEKYPSMDVKDPPLPPRERCPHPLPRRHTAHRCFDLLSDGDPVTIPFGVAINPPGEVNEQKKSRKGGRGGGGGGGLSMDCNGV